MKLHILILLAVLTIGCSNDESDTESNANRPRAARTPSSSKEETPHLDKEKEGRILQKIQEFISTNYTGWTLKGTGNLGSSPIDLHIVKGTDEKIVKVNYKELNDLNGQPYIVISEISQNDITNTNVNSAEQKSEVNTDANK